ncbi:hypothetical protein ACHAWF_009209 [Thalassiosira exigua]
MRTRWRRRSLASALRLCFGAGLLYAASHSLLQRGDRFNAPADADAADRRGLSVALPNGGCRVTRARLADAPIAPTWQASFPGSGSRMTWTLVEALTGVKTNDDFDSHERGYERVVAVKTHHPVNDARRKFGELDESFGRAIVILRNPVHAIPSNFNFQWEHQHHLPNHSTRGPTEDWLKYRDSCCDGQGIAVQIQTYEKFVEYWMQKYSERRNLLIVSYEELTDNLLGPTAATEIALFLGETEGVNPIDIKSIPCVWDTIINYNDSNNRRNGEELKGEVGAENLSIGGTRLDPKSLRTGPKVRPYTEQNLQEMTAMLHRLLEKYSRDEDLVRIVSSYIETVSSTPPNQGMDV